MKKPISLLCIIGMILIAIKPVGAQTNSTTLLLGPIIDDYGNWCAFEDRSNRIKINCNNEIVYEFSIGDVIIRLESIAVRGKHVVMVGRVVEDALVYQHYELPLEFISKDIESIYFPVVMSQ